LEVQKSTNGAVEVEQRFRRLESQWRAGTQFHSNPSIVMGHPAMRAIVAMGAAVVPIICVICRQSHRSMVWALPEITGENLAPPKVEGGFVKWNIPAQ